MAGGAEMAAFARKGKQIFMPAVRTFDPGETMVQVTAVKVSVDNLFGVGAEKAVLPAERLIINLFKGLKVIFNTLVIL
jgi:hypothetical protein